MARIDEMFRVLRDKGGSDLHLSPGNPPLMRLAGDLVPLRPDPLTPAESQALIFEIADEAQRRQFDETHDVDFAYEALCCSGDPGGECCCVESHSRGIRPRATPRASSPA